MNVAIFDTFADLNAHASGRFSYPEVEDFFLTLEWFQCLYDVTSDGRSCLRLYCADDSSGRPVAALYCLADRNSRKLRSLSNFYTMAFSPVFSSKCEERQKAVRDLVSFIADEKPRWNVVDLRFVPSDTIDNLALDSALERNGFWCTRFLQYENWYSSTDQQGFEDYYQERPSRLRNTARRKLNKLKRSSEIEFQLFSDVESEIEAGIRDYNIIYGKSWKRPEPYPLFMRSLASVCGKLGVLRLGLLYVDGKPVAAQFWIVAENRATIYKLAYDEAFVSLSPGTILSKYMFERIIDADQPREIDYGVGSEPYKKDWMDSVRELEGVLALNRRTFVGRSAILKEQVSILAKKLYRKS